MDVTGKQRSTVFTIFLKIYIFFRAIKVSKSICLPVWVFGSPLPQCYDTHPLKRKCNKSGRGSAAALLARNTECYNCIRLAV